MITTLPSSSFLRPDRNLVTPTHRIQVSVNNFPPDKAQRMGFMTSPESSHGVTSVTSARIGWMPRTVRGLDLDEMRIYDL